jgi:peroxiredoxin
LPQLEAHHILPVGVSADPVATTRAHLAKTGWTFPFLCDPGAVVIRRYGLLHPKAGEGGADIARPAELLIDPSGTVRWVNLTEDFRVRARPETVLEVQAKLAAGGR